MRERFKLLLIPIIILACGLPGISSGLFIFDDLQIIKHFSDSSDNWFNLLSQPDSRYWRPILMLTFAGDVFLWNTNPGLMHLVNVLIHAGNALLVFMIVAKLEQVKGDPRSHLPLLAAILFALHPITCESTNWIAARSDPLAALFVLMTIWLVLESLQKKSIVTVCGAALVLLAGCLAKEVALFIIPGVVWLVLFCKSGTNVSRNSQSTTWRATASLPFLMIVPIYFGLRARALSIQDQGVSRIIDQLPQATGGESSNISLLSQLQEAITAFGFYLKKLFFPYPLNFAIDQVSTLYLIPGLFAILAITWLMIRRDLRSGMLLCMLLGIIPAIINAVFMIAWTPYAERYLYIPAAFFCIFLCTASRPQMSLSGKPLLVLLLLASFLPQTLYRSLQWHDSFNILADAHSQNPLNQDLHLGYALLMADRVSPIAARDELAKIIEADPQSHSARFNLAIISLDVMNDPVQARKDLDIYFSGGMKPNGKVQELMEEIEEARVRGEG